MLAPRGTLILVLSPMVLMLMVVLYVAISIAAPLAGAIGMP